MEHTLLSETMALNRFLEKCRPKHPAKVLPVQCIYRAWFQTVVYAETPCLVTFSGVDVVVGYKAAALSDHNPHNTLYDAKRFLGKNFSRDELAGEAGRYPFKVDKYKQM